MISVVLAAGSLSKELSLAVFSSSPLRIPLGSQVSTEVVVSREMTFSEECIVVVKSFEEVPGWLIRTLPEVSWVELDTQSRGSIGDSLLKALDSLSPKAGNQPLRVIFADTLSDIHGIDRVSVATPQFVEDWTFAPESLAVDVVDPRARVIDPRVITGAFVFGDLRDFREALVNAITSLSREEVADPVWLALRNYASAQDHPLEYFLDTEWVDVGHIDSLFTYRRTILAGRVTNNFSEKGLFIEKSSVHKEKLERESNWFGSVSPELFEFLPRVSLGSKEGYSIQFLKGLSLSEVLLFSEADQMTWDWIVSALGQWFEKTESFTNPTPDESVSDKWFREHFKSRISQLWDWAEVNPGLKFGLSSVDIESLDSEINRLSQILGSSKSVLIHGDLILSNIMVMSASRSIKLIDPRGGFEVESIYGPQLYDWAKLAQGIWGRYEEIVAGHFTLEKSLDNNGVEFWADSSRDANYSALETWFLSKCPDTSNSIKLGGLLLLSACPFHFEDRDRVGAMTLMGLKMLEIR